jgi:hypothetical protein
LVASAKVVACYSANKDCLDWKHDLKQSPNVFAHAQENANKTQKDRPAKYDEGAGGDSATGLFLADGNFFAWWLWFWGLNNFPWPIFRHGVLLREES